MATEAAEAAAADSGPFRATPAGLRVALQVRPGASRAGIDGLAATAEGGLALRVRVTAAPEAGKANDAVIALLAGAWKLPKRDLEIVGGRSGRRKTLLIAGDAAALRARLESWLTSVRDRPAGP